MICWVVVVGLGGVCICENGLDQIVKSLVLATLGFLEEHSKIDVLMLSVATRAVHVASQLLRDYFRAIVIDVGVVACGPKSARAFAVVKILTGNLSHLFHVGAQQLRLPSWVAWVAVGGNHKRGRCSASRTL